MELEAIPKVKTWSYFLTIPYPAISRYMERISQEGGAEERIKKCYRKAANY